MKYLKCIARKEVSIASFSCQTVSKLRRTSICTMACSEVPTLLLLPVPGVAADYSTKTSSIKKTFSFQ